MSQSANPENQRWLCCFSDSAKELKNPKALAMLAMLLAMHVVLGFFQINLADFVRISFAMLPIGVAGMLYGPTAGLIVGALGDPLKYLVSPTGAYFPGFTLSSALTGLIFGLLLYHMQRDFLKGTPKWKPIVRLAVTELILKVFVNFALYSLWLHLLYGTAWSVLLPARALKCLISFPIDTVLLYLLLAAVARYADSRRGRYS